jgi:DNA polymerase III subunit epsilon
MREIILDTETTGLRPEDGHKIVEIGCVELIDKKITDNNLQIYINPERPSSIEALKIHNLTEEFLADKPKFSDVKQQFLDFIANDSLIIHNARFDMKFLNYELEICGVSELNNNVIDTLHIARKKFPGSPANLDALCKRFKVDSSTRTHHGALLDSQLLAEVYIELTAGKRQKDLELSEEISKDFLDPRFARQVVDFPRREFNITSDEDEKHKEMLKEIKDNYWN